MNVSLPDEMKAFVEERVAAGGYATSSEFLRELIRHEQERDRFRRLLLEGANSSVRVVADRDFFDSLRQRVAESGR